MKNYSSTVENPCQECCPEGPSSWCSYQCDIANGTSLQQPLTDPHPQAVVKVIQPLFDRLGDALFLVGCKNCYIQSSNKSLHHVIWGMAPKDVYSSPKEIRTATSLEELQFNQGYHRTYSEQIPTLGVGIEEQAVEKWEGIGKKRFYQADYHNSTSYFGRWAFSFIKNITYKSQGFHGGKKGKGPKLFQKE